MKFSEWQENAARETLRNPRATTEEKEVAARVLGLVGWGEQYVKEEQAKEEKKQLVDMTAQEIEEQLLGHE